MSALTSDLGNLAMVGDIETASYKLKGGLLFWQGASVAIDAAGFLVPASNTAGLRVVGVAMERVSTVGIADGLRSVQVASGRFYRSAVAVTQVMVGKRVYVADDQTVTGTVGLGVLGGVLESIEPDGRVVVRIEPLVSTVSA